VSGKVDVTITADDAGWMLTLPSNEMVLADSVTFNGEVFFVSFSPDNEMVLADSVTFNGEVFFVSFSPDVAAANACNAGQGTNRLWRVSIINGDPIVDNVGDIPTGGDVVLNWRRVASHRHHNSCSRARMTRTARGRIVHHRPLAASASSVSTRAS
jgi:hypothetical protein